MLNPTPQDRLLDEKGRPYFRWDCERIEGDDKISVELHRGNDDAVWWYSVAELAEYTFLRMPVIESCAHELAGLVEGDRNPDARYWRWVAPVQPGVIVGGGVPPPNLKVDFIVVGYRPKALIKAFTS